MRRFERSNQCLAPSWHLFPLPTPLQSGIRDACEVHEDGIDDLSRYGREECDGHVGFNVEHTGTWAMGAAAGGAACTKFFPGRLERGPKGGLFSKICLPRTPHLAVTLKCTSPSAPPARSCRTATPEQARRSNTQHETVARRSVPAKAGIHRILTGV